MTAVFLQGETSMVGIIVPAVVFIISFIFTYALYRHFSRKGTSPESREKK